MKEVLLNTTIEEQYNADAVREDDIALLQPEECVAPAQPEEYEYPEPAEECFAPMQPEEPFSLDQVRSLLEDLQTEEAEALLLQQLFSAPGRTPAILFQTAELCGRHGQSALAEAAYQAILELDAHHLGALGRLGDVAFEQGEFLMAADFFRRIIEQDVTPPDWAYIGLGNALERLEEYEEAAECLANVPDAPRLALRIALLKQRVGLFDEAIDYFEKINLDELADKTHQIIIDIHVSAQKNMQNKLARRVQSLLDKIAQYRSDYLLDGFLSANELRGWLRDKNTPQQALTLELLENEQIVATARNDQAHNKRGAGGFSFTLPAALLDGNAHSFTLRVKEHAGHLGVWHFVTPLASGKTHDRLAFLDNPVWKDLPANKLIDARRRKEKPVMTALEQQLKTIKDALAETDDDNLARRYDLICQLGYAFLGGGKLDEALEQFLAAMTFDDVKSNAIVACAKTLVALGREPNAEATVQAALQLMPDNASLLELNDKFNAARRPKKTKTIAFYLPQYHPTPENDLWWGRGFTEWTNVGSATPLFNGHLQPRRPTALGYYDLRLPESANAQFDLARRYGIDGFCYYYYWFDGKRILERPLQDLVNGKTGPFPFCICWANEDWTRSWDGSSGEVLMGQNHTPESDFNFIKDIAPLLRHPDYVRQDGKPVVTIYRADKLASAKETLQAWREWCREEGIGELHLCAVQSFGFGDPRPLGFDAAVEFPPHPVQHARRKSYKEFYTELTNLPGQVPGFSGKIFDYQAYAEAFMQRPREPYTLHRTCFAAWDNTARRQKTAHVFHNFSVKTFERWLSSNASKAALEQEDPLVFVNAWNEWAEGSVMEPDDRFGYEILESARKASRTAVYDTFQSYWRKGQPIFPENRVEQRERVLLFGHDALLHGAQTNLLNMARCLKRELDTDVAMFLISGGELLGEYERVAVTEVIGNGDGWRDALRSTLRHYMSLGTRKAICNTVVTGEIAEILHQEGYQVISLVHELPTLIETHGLQDRCWRAAGNADNIVFASKVVAEQFCDRYWPDPQKILIAPQGIALNPYHRQRAAMRAEVRKELELAPATRIMIGCGYADTRKGIDLFVQMAGEVTRQCGADSVAFVWVGDLDASIAPYVQADIQRLDLTDNFRVTGKTNTPFRYFIAGEIFALTSREDPFPSVVMEAFDAGLPVVAFDGGGGYVDIVNDSTGALVPYIDVAAMSAAIVGLLNDEPRRASIGEYTHQLCREQFSYAPYMRKLLALLGGVPAAQVAKGVLKRQAWFAETPHPTISVIVPNYNYGRYMELRLRTILDQTLTPDEIIILDDASSDYSLEIINAMARQSAIPIRIVTNDTNSGNPFVQWAKGIEMATGDLIWIAEADDYCEPTLLETLARELVDDKVAMAWADSIMVDDNGQSGGFEYKNYYAKSYGGSWHTHFRIAGKTLIDNCLLAENVVPNASAVLFRRKAVGDVLGLIKQYRFSGDWWFWISLAQAGDVVYRADPLNYHRRHNRSVMGDVLREGEKLLPETMHFYQRVVAHKPECLSPKTRLQVLERLENLYRLFPALPAAYPRLADHPDYKVQYNALFADLDPVQALIATRSKVPATLVISQDALTDGDTASALMHQLKSDHCINLVLLSSDAQAEAFTEKYGDSTVECLTIDPNPKRSGKFSALDAKKTQKPESTLPPAAQLLAAIDDSGSRRIITFGLAAHALTGSAIDGNPMDWLLIAGREFDDLLGNLPKDSGVTLAALRHALAQCQQAQFIGGHPPHAFARMMQETLKPIEAYPLLPVAKIASATPAKEQPVRFLGVAANVATEVWQAIADALQQAEDASKKKACLRILAWGADIERLRQGLQGQKNVEVLAVFEKPREFSGLGDVGLDLQPASDDAAGGVHLDFKQSGMPVIATNGVLQPYEIAQYFDTAANMVDPL